MKKILIALACCLASLHSQADEQRKITLSADNPAETINLSYCNIFVTLLNLESDDNIGKVLIEVENLDESKLLALYHQPYTEKQLKKLRPSFQYDKLFGGSKGKRIVNPYSRRMDDDMFIEPSQKKNLPTFDISGDEQQVVKLPIYLAKSKDGIIERILGQEKLLLLRMQLIELDIEVSLKPTAEYLNMQQEVATLKKDLEGVVFCNARRHKPSVEEQQEPFVKRIEELRIKIDAIISAHQWGPEDGGYKRFTALKDDIDNNIDLNKHVGTCRTHTASGNARQGHSCSYCSMTLQQIYHRMDDLYRTIYISSNREAKKREVMGQVNALYGCCTASDCSRHASQWANGGGGYRTRITSLYNRIQGL